MPKIQLNDTEVARLRHGPLTWYSHNGDKFAGLRLAVTKSAKTWYVSKRDPHSGKVRSIKLGRFPAMSRDDAWKDAELRASRIDNADPEAGEMPTFREQLEKYITFRTADRKTGKAKMREATGDDYRACAELHFADWMDTKLDEIPIRKVEEHLNDLQAAKPYAAQRMHVIAGAVFKFDHHLQLTPPRLKEQTRMQARELDRKIEWADRWAEIEAVDNPVKRICWMLRWHTGSRENVLRALTWQDVDLERGTVTFPRLKRDENGRTIALSDYSWALFKRLVGQHTKWCFPSVRNGVHLDALDRLPLTSPGDLRHLWHDAAMLTGTPVYMMRWLNGQNLKAGEVDMLGHYGQIDDIDAQQEAANRISSYIKTRSEKLGNLGIAKVAVSA